MKHTGKRKKRQTDVLDLAAPPVEYSLDENNTKQPYYGLVGNHRVQRYIPVQPHG